MKQILYFLLFSLLCLSCKDKPRVAYTYNEETGKRTLDTIPYNDIRDFPAIKNTENIDSLLNVIKVTDCVYEKNVGIGGSFSEQYARFEKVKDLLSEKDLFKLLDDESPIVRVYAFKGLQMKKSSYLERAKVKIKNDTTNLSWMGGCISKTKKVADFVNE